MSALLPIEYGIPQSEIMTAHAYTDKSQLGETFQLLILEAKFQVLKHLSLLLNEMIVRSSQNKWVSTAWSAVRMFQASGVVSRQHKGRC